ncbi:SpoIIE family protein phosphatase [Chlamydia abortus]|uniref:Exported protein n=1 Tax=Chlamydia abortus (strain DSM 27085 / S26/3) TaxID=218497 RepID=Q5L4S3_CHLAB|nr:SpoIIE family protein phosphatase [Chlamydia abortus]ASD31033.1 regulator of sigma subunit [Chlamydia abortus]AUS60417.1 RsbU family protein [Chlamydia abortus]QRR31677.1 SpoIIE family protein phosphatase [Chlamydia abortus]CAH64373.1 putative exported protein [Chlamydia abortus S26/3]CED80977.1 putative exported protein [Chlamydia abortus]
MKQTFTKRILLFLFLVIPIPLILNLVVLSLFSFSAAKSNLMENLHTHATNFSLEFEKKLTIHKVFLKRLANTLALKAYSSSSEDCYSQAYNEMFALSNMNFSLCLIPLVQGNIKTKTPHDPFIHYLKEHPEIKKKLSMSVGKACLITVPSSSNTHFTHYLVITEDIEVWNSPTSAGLLVSFYPMDFLQRDLFKSLHLKDEDICLLNKYGEVLFASSPQFSSEVFSLDIADLPKITARKQATPLEAAPKILHEQKLISVKIKNKRYLGLVLNKLPIQGTYTLSIIPLSWLVIKAIRLPLNVIFFYSLAFIFMGWILSKINKRLNQPIQELTTCMEAAWRGNHNIRYEPQPYGYEINELGNIFNCTLLLLLNSKEKAEIERLSGDKLQKELAILSSLQKALLRPDFPEFPNVSFISKHLQGMQRSGHFYGWKTSIPEQSFVGVIGLAGDIGLPSYLYALSARSLFLAYANLSSSLENICSHTFEAFGQTTEGDEATISMTFIRYCSTDRKLSILSAGETPPVAFLKRQETFSRLISPSVQNIQPGDVLVCITGNKELTEYLLRLPIEELIRDPLAPLNSDNFIETLTDMLNKETQSQIDGTLSFLSFF